MKNSFFLMTLICSIALSGCGTVIANKNIYYYGDDKACEESERLNIPLVYSGTWVDIKEYILFPFTCKGEKCSTPYFIVLPLSIIDLPLSFAADTISLPNNLKKHNDCKNKEI